MTSARPLRPEFYQLMEFLLSDIGQVFDVDQENLTAIADHMGCTRAKAAEMLTSLKDRGLLVAHSRKRFMKPARWCVAEHALDMPQAPQIKQLALFERENSP